MRKWKVGSLVQNLTWVIQEKEARNINSLDSNLTHCNIVFIHYIVPYCPFAVFPLTSNPLLSYIPRQFFLQFHAPLISDQKVKTARSQLFFLGRREIDLVGTIKLYTSSRSCSLWMSSWANEQNFLFESSQVAVWSWKSTLFLVPSSNGYIWVYPFALYPQACFPVQLFPVYIQNFNDLVKMGIF